MATLIHQLSESLHLPSASSIGALARGSLNRFNQYRRERRNQAQILAHLSIADDRELRDLNINRYDFEAIAKGEFRRD
jgi:uncharacterized protein YjiS (DUF1127 family)